MSQPTANDPKSRTGPRPGAPPDAPPRRRARLNLRAALALTAAVVAAVPAYVIVRHVQESRSRSALRKQAQAYLDQKPPQPALAIKYLGRYLELSGGDLEAMDLRARLLAETARTAGDVEEATIANDQIVRISPEGPARQEARRRLAELILRAEFYRPLSEVKYNTAEATAQQLIALDKKAGRPDARDHRLLGRALLGEEYLGNRNALARALAEFEEAARLDPGDIPGAERLAYLLVEKSKDRGRADAVLAALLKANPTPRARLARFRHYARFGPSEKARAELERAAQEAPGDLEIRLAAAEDALDRNEPGAARAQLAAIPAEGRNDVRARFLQGLLELRENHADDAIAAWRQGLRLSGGTNADLSFRLAWVLLQLGRPDDAAPLMGQVRRLTGGGKPSPEYRYLEALRDARAGQPAKALATLEEIRPLVGRGLRAALCMTMGQCYEAARNEPRALDAYREASAAQPRSTEAYLAAARLLAAMRGPEAAADELRHALETMPDDPNLLTGLARLLWQQRQWTDMRQVLERAARVAPGAPGLLALRAEYLAGVGKLDDAVKLLADAAEHQDRANAALWAAYANGLARQGKLDDALKALDRAAADDAAGDRAAVRVARARLLQQAGRGREARDELGRDMARLPAADRPQVLRARAELEVLQGDRAEATATLRRWSALAPDDPQPALTMLDVALSGGDQAAADDAIAALKAVRQGDGAYEYIGRAYEALRAARNPRLVADRPARLDEAGRLIRRIAEIAPQLPQGHLMQGLLLEERAREETLSPAGREALLDQAISSYQRALDNGGAAAIARLVDLLTVRHKPVELAVLKKRVANDEAFDRLTLERSMRHGLRDEAERLISRIVEGDPEGLETRALQADVLRRLGRADEAEEALRELAKAHPGDPGPWFQLLLFQAGRNRREAAGSTVEQILRNVKGDRPEFLYAQAYRVAGDLRRAGELFQVALKKWPDDPQVARGASDFLEATGKLDEAAAALERVLARDPAASWATRKLALILSAKPKDAAAFRRAVELARPAGTAPGASPDDRLTWALVLSRSPEPAVAASAIPVLKKLKDDLPPTTPVGSAARARLVRYFLESDRPTEARQLAADALGEGDEPSADALAMYAESLLRDKKPEEAEKQIARLEKLEPGTLRAESLRGRLLAARGKPEEADALLEEAFRRRKSAPDALVAAATVLTTLADLGHLDAAERVAQEEAKLRPADSWMLARVLAKRERNRDALDACLKAAREGGSRAAVQIAIGMARPGVGDETLAGVDRVLEEAIRREPKAVDLLLDRAQVRHLQGRFDDEVALYAQIQALKPSDYGYLNNWAWTLSEGLGKPEEGLRRIDDAIRWAGRYPAYLDTRGMILARLGRTSEAVEALREAAPNLPGGQGELHLAHALFKDGQDAEARDALARARAAGLKPEALEPAERRDLESLTDALAKGTPTPRPTPRPRT